MAHPLSSAWTRHLPDQKAREDFAVIVRNSTLLLTRLGEILEEQEKQSVAASYSQDDFKDPNWSHKQAFRNGRLSMIKTLKEIITI